MLYTAVSALRARNDAACLQLYERIVAMTLTVGIIGLPQSGKTSLFNALTHASAPVTGYPTSTVQANMAIINVPDERVERLAEIFHPRKKTLATVEFVDVAGLASAAADQPRTGLSAEYLGHIRNADALAVVVRCFVHPTVPGTVDAQRDMDDLMTTLLLTDLMSVERRIERTQKAAKSGEKKYQAELDLLQRVHQELSSGTSASQIALDAADRAVIDELFLLTLKPRLYVANVSEATLGPAGDLLASLALGSIDPAAAIAIQQGELRAVAQVGARAKAERSEAIAVSAKLEAELNDLPPEEASEYLSMLNLPQLGADRVIQAGYRLLNLVTFLTAGEDEVRAWTVRAGSKAPTAAGKVHTDIERGFIRAEVVRYEDLIAVGSFAAAREKGLLRLEGKEYVIQDGDIAHFRFNVSK
jgi:ribosome-binding ATPase YchF (GTP1/OBG family)